MMTCPVATSLSVSTVGQKHSTQWQQRGGGQAKGAVRTKPPPAQRCQDEGDGAGLEKAEQVPPSHAAARTSAARVACWLLTCCFLQLKHVRYISDRAHCAPLPPSGWIKSDLCFMTATSTRQKKWYMKTQLSSMTTLQTEDMTSNLWIISKACYPVLCA